MTETKERGITRLEINHHYLRQQKGRNCLHVETDIKCLFECLLHRREEPQATHSLAPPRRRRPGDPSTAGRSGTTAAPGRRSW